MDLLKQIHEIDAAIQKQTESENAEMMLAEGIMPSGGMGLSGDGSEVPWSQTSLPWALDHDFDHDGIPDALDDHFGSGAFDHE